MKTNNKIIVKIITIILLITMIVTFTHCVPQQAPEIGDGTGIINPTRNHHSSPPNGPKSEGEIINELQVSVGVKSFEQIYYTMAAITGADYNRGDLRNIYNQVQTSLPTTNDIKIFSSTQQIAITKLAAEFCSVTAGNATLRARLWPSLNYNVAPATAFNAVNEEIFINETIDSFFGGVISEDERAAAHEELGNLINLIINNDNNTAATQRTVRGVCIAALSSAHVTFL